MFDFHIAALYGVETRALKQQVKRNMERFPEDFMFPLTPTEWSQLITNCDNLLSARYSPALPYVFTEQGVSMLSSVLRSEKAIQVNIAIMRAFVHMRELLEENRDLRLQLEQLESKYDQQFAIVFEAIRKLMGLEEKADRPRIGFPTTQPA